MKSAAVPSPKLYLIIWFWLAGLMLLGVLLSELPISKSAIVTIILLLSSIKAILVSLYYMHLKADHRLLAVVLLAPLLLIGLAVALVLSSRLIRL
ncbi:MAG: cytochrome C oxidase subunit IV family protein [Candidatus Omnitrophica bacterium]|nr:cytochrome C oxidase subunit IV family protein [Candidatus Omnitrophota bacterium]